MDTYYSNEIIKIADRITKGRTFEENFKISTLLLIILLEYFFLFANVNYMRDFILYFPKSLVNLIDIMPNFALILSIFVVFFYLGILTLILIDFFKNNKSYIWRSDSLLKDWDFQGSIVIEEDGGDNVIKVKTSEVGAIVKNRSWKNFTLSFDFKIPAKISYGQKPKEDQLERGFGIIYRAKNLNQYYMLKVDKTGYLPHIKSYQYWENNGPTITIKKLTSSVLDTWITAKLVMRDNVLSVTIGSDHFNLFLPTYSIVNREKFPDETEKHHDKYKPNPYAPIKYSKGTIGIRSYPLEEVFIRNLKVISDNILFILGRKIKNCLSF